jgi:hypothetical protein
MLAFREMDAASVVSGPPGVNPTLVGLPKFHLSTGAVRERDVLLLRFDDDLDLSNAHVTAKLWRGTSNRIA